MPPIKLPSFRSRRNVYPPDLWTKCPSCEEMLFNKQLDKANRVCPACGHRVEDQLQLPVGEERKRVTTLFADVAGSTTCIIWAVRL